MFDRSMTQEELGRLYDGTIVDEAGEKLGGVGQIYLDDQTDRPTWATVKTGLFGTRETFVPLQGATGRGEDICVPYTKDFVKDAPNLDADGHLSPEEEAELYRYYGLGDGRGGRDEHAGRQERVEEGDARPGAAGVGAAGIGAEATHRHDDRDHVHAGQAEEADSVVRREEELHVGTERVATGQVRLRKHVVTEQKTVTVPVQREEYTIEREPIREGETGGRIGDDDGAVVTLHEERPVVEKETVAKECIGLGKEVHTDEQQVTETVAKEQVEVERDGERRGGVEDLPRH